MSQNAWQKTKEAVVDFRKLLLCSKCSKLMSEPLCLGTCEHMFCKSCAGACAGGECSVCFCPAWVKDIQINRQLSNITDLFRNLEGLLAPPEVSATPPIEPCEAAEVSPIVKRKKRYRIWTSPRSHRIRCRVESHGEATLFPADLAQHRPRPQKALFRPQDASVYNFPASSQDSGSSSPSRTVSSGGSKRKRKPAKNVRVRQALVRAQMAITRKQKRKLQLQVINQQWGIGTHAEAGAPEERREESEGGGDGSEREGKRPRKRVSFQNPDSPLHEDHPKENAPPSENLVTASRSAMSDTGLLSGASTAPPESIKQPASPSKLPPCRMPKRARPAGGGVEPQRSPKRPRASPGVGGWPAAVDGLSTLSTPPPSPSPQALSSPRGSPGGSRREPGLSPGPSPAGGRRSQGRQSQGSPAFAKRNHKGETPLHLAAIKGDVEAVKRLLEQGADPNLKDNAGWTPLHEASNHGHAAVVEALILGGSLLNTPGYQNDSPLHDAVRNGHAAIVRLLLEHGASQSVLNMFGLRALDCAETPEMREILLGASERGHPLHSPLSPPASLSKTGACGQKDGRVTLLGSKLTQPQRRQLAQAARLLGARLADAFSSAVTHVVVAEGGVPTTLSTLQGILNGCWILHFSWVKACRQAGARAAEVEHEAGEGPQRSRFNRDNLLPRLLDGCFFFLLGSFQRPEKADLLTLIREGGGQVLSRQPKPDSDVTQTLSAAAYHARPGSDQALCTQYILYEPQGAYRPSRVRLGKVWSAPASWLLDCISAFQLLPVPELEPAPAP
ncbi:BRCA1-associated RING domain protein 1 [Alosa sapidissima]|uniref:BRCA1-associated RING domain protein 1 n=1 Tax=Alosa sapidissima TaxID=34773 RepID=UPI001C0947B4|nr:BRCA1-associated RING domain protein 1 [Alosa sapidissima]